MTSIVHKTIQNIKNITLVWWLSLASSLLMFGLIFHFIGINFLQFVVGIGKPWISIISLWKEGVIALMMVLIIVGNVKKYGSLRLYWKSIIEDGYFKWIAWGFVVVILITIVSSLINGSIGNYLLAFRYDLFPYLIFLLGYQIALLVWSNYIKKMTHKYVLFLRWIIGFWLVRFFIIWSLPWFLKLFGYDKTVYEWKIGERPPAVYYAALDHGAPRNQFIWERPIFYGFYLVAFWPLFFFIYLRKAPKTEGIFYGALYVLNVFSTFSRSAWLVWLCITCLMLLLLYGRGAIKYAKYLAIPVVLFGLLVWRYFYYEIFGSGRNFSNTGHINAFFQAVEILKSHRLFGLWAGTAWPASHQLGIGFNTENQYLQMRVEYGIFGFVAWLLYFWYMTISWVILGWRNKLKNYIQNSNVLDRDNHRLVLLSCNLGLLGLAICGLMLHSLADKMVFWPLLLLYGLWLGMKKE